MSFKLDREGIFKARPLSWGVRTFDSSSTVAINIEFAVVAQLNAENGWDDWNGYEEHTCWGMFFVIKKNGEINTVTVEQLVNSLGWNGDLRAGLGEPPDRIVQITVKENEYNGKISYKATWINPEDYAPQPQSASEDEVAALSSRFGSLLRAAAAGAKRANGSGAGKVPGNGNPPRKPSPAPAADPSGGPVGPEPPPPSDDDLAF